MGALERLEISGDETFAVFGQGPVGLSGTMLAAARGLRVIQWCVPVLRTRFSFGVGDASDCKTGP